MCDTLYMDVGKITRQEFLTYFETEYGLDMYMTRTRVSILSSFFVNPLLLLRQ